MTFKPYRGKPVAAKAAAAQEGFAGLGRAERRRMVKRWKAEGGGLSLKQWAQQNNLVGDAAQAWIESKRSAS